MKVDAVHPKEGNFATDSAVVSLTNNYPATGSLTLKKDFTTDSAATNDDKAKNFIYEIVFRAPQGITFTSTDITTVYPVAPATPSKIDGTPSVGSVTVVEGASAVTYSTLTYRVKVSKDQSDDTTHPGVTISGLPAGTTYTLSEDLSDAAYSGWQYIKTTYNADANQTIASGETETATVVNAKTNSLKLLKTLHGNSGTTSATFSYTVKLEPPTDVTLAELKAIVEAKNTAYSTWTEGPADETTKTYITNTITGIPTDTTGKSIVGLPYGTKYTVTENLTSGWVKVGETYGNNAQKIGATPENNTYTAQNAKIGSLKLVKELTSVTPSTYNSTLFEYAVDLTLPNDMTFDYTNGVLSVKKGTVTVSTVATGQNITYTVGAVTNSNEAFSNVTVDNDHANIVTVKLHVAKSMNGGTDTFRTITGLPYGTTYHVTEPSVPEETGAVWTKYTNDSGTTNANTNGTITDEAALNVQKTATITNGLTGSLDGPDIFRCSIHSGCGVCSR